jgi:hypothetical protein
MGGWQTAGGSSSVPAPTTTTLGGVYALAGATAHNFVTFIDNTGTLQLAQPAFTDISGSLSPSQIPLFTSTTQGAVSASGGGTTKFARADGGWAVPPGAVSSVTASVTAGGNGILISPTTGAVTVALQSGLIIPSSAGSSVATIGDNVTTGSVNLNLGSGGQNTTAVYETFRGITSNTLYLGHPTYISTTGTGTLQLCAGGSSSGSSINFYSGGTGNTSSLVQAGDGNITGNWIHTLPQANSNTIQPLTSQTAGNYLTYIDANGVQHSGTVSAVTPGGTNGQIQYNNSGAFGGTSNITLPQLPTGMTGQMQCRLYLTSGSPYADATNATNFYVGPAGGGNNVALPDATGNVYTTLPLSEITTAVPAGYFRIYDVFLYNNSGTAAVSTTAWDSGGQVSGTITSVSIANPAVISTSNTSGLSAGDLIGVAGIVGTVGSATNGLNGRVFKVASIVANTSITLETGINTASTAYTSGGNWYRIPVARTTGLTFQNGQYLRTGALNKVYIGSFMAGAGGVSGQAQDNTSSRLCWSYFNRLNRQLQLNIALGDYTYAGTTDRPANNNTTIGTTRLESLCGIVDDVNYVSLYAILTNGTGAFGCGINTLTSEATSLIALGVPHTGYVGNTPSVVPALGYSFYQALDRSFSGGTTYATASYGPNHINIQGRF